VEPLEEVIDDLIKAMRANHIYRMTHGLCEIYSGLQFENILSNLERLSDQCSDLAVFMLSHDDPGLIGQEHQYLHDLHRSQDPTYQTLFQSNFAKYFGQLDAVTPPGTDPTA
jgi:phosphate:Na+ symporter